MKKLYTVSYDFKNAGPDQYGGFFHALTEFGPWWHFLSGTWLIATDLTASEIFARLRPTLDRNASVLVAELGQDYNGWLPKPAWEWLAAQREQFATTGS